MNDKLNNLLNQKQIFVIGIFSLGLPQFSLAQSSRFMGGVSSIRGNLAEAPVVSISGGVTDFRKGAMKTLSDQGATWDLRALWGWDSPVGIELAYIGSSHNLDGPTGDSSYLVGNGVEAAARWNFMQSSLKASRDGYVQPYAVAGAAWKNYRIDESIQDADTGTVDDIMEVPAGVGLSYYFADNFVVDARAAYRWAFYNDLVEEGGETLDNWNVAARVGWVF